MNKILTVLGLGIGGATLGTLLIILVYNSFILIGFHGFVAFMGTFIFIVATGVLSTLAYEHIDKVLDVFKKEN